MSSEAARRTDLGGQLLLETCVLRTLCLTVNSDGSELKYRILDALAEEDFYFPITRTIFSAVSTLHRDGDHVVAASLQEILNQRSTDVPDDFHVEDLFRGELPSLGTLSGWIEKLQTAAKPGGSLPAASSKETATLQKTHPSVKAAPAPQPPGERAPLESPAPRGRPSAPPPGKPSPSSTLEGVADLEPPFPPVDAGERSDEDGVLAPESGDWLGFLADLTKKQGERLKTGFSGFDADWGGLRPGLVLLAGEDRELLLDFLKQLVDQIASGSRGPCLYLSFERSKAALRLQTLSRLSGASAADIEKGGFGKDSAKWQEIVRAGEHAVEWLQRIYVVEARPGLSVTRIRELRQGLIESGAGAPRLVAVDNVEKLAKGGDLLHSVAELKELAEAFGIVVVGTATAMDLVHERSADMAATFHRENGGTVVKLSAGRAHEPAVLRFEHRSDTHRFDERAMA